MTLMVRGARMTRTLRPVRTALLILGLGLFTGLAGDAAGIAAAGELISLPTAEITAHRFAAEVDDATAVFLNPAGIGVLTGNNMFVAVAGNDEDVDEFSAGVQGGVLAVGYRHRDIEYARTEVDAQTQIDPTFTPIVEANLDTYVIAAGVGPTWLRVGAAFARVTSDLPGEAASCWRAGLRSRPHPLISVGATADHIDGPSFLNGELCTSYTYGLALHPLPGRPEWLTLNVEGTHLDGHSAIDLAYSVRLLTPRGLELALLVRDDNGEDPQVGFRGTVHLGPGSAEAGFRSVAGRESDMRWYAAGHLYDDHWRRARAPREKMGS